MNKCIRIFLLCFALMTVILLPDIIRNGGYFLYAGDYAYQQIPFYQHVSDMIRHGNTGWDWLTELGTDMIGSYSFYLLGSVFFWIISWLPGRAIILAMPFMIAFKTAVATVTSYVYIRRYVGKDESAYFGAIMYAFSGFQMSNIIFNHFHDVTALFPLLLLSFDMLVKEDRRCCFALMTAVMAVTNYFFFVGQVVFIIMYYIIRCCRKDFRFELKKFFIIFAEAVMGTAMAAAVLLPTFMFVSSGERVSSVLSGTDLINYSDNTIIPKIVQSLFLLPDSPSSAKLFKSELNPNNWASVSLYLPLFASAGTAVYVKNNRKHWISILLLCCGTAACVPVLNSAFYMFNVSYYARWYYMPVLFMCIATAYVTDNSDDIMFGIRFQGAGLAVLSIIGLFPRMVDTVSDAGSRLDENYKPVKELKWFSMSETPVIFWQSIAFGVIFLLVLFVYNKLKDSDEKILKKILAVMSAFIVITNIIYINDTVGILNFMDYRETALDYVPELENEDEFFRISDIKIRNLNRNIMWGLLSTTGFHSIVPSESEQFYENVQGKERKMSAVYEQEDYPVYGLLSVKYVFNGSTGDDLNVENYPAKLKGFKLFDKQSHYYIYENEHFVPVGYMYDYYITDGRLDETLDRLGLEGEERFLYKKMIMMRALVLEENDSEKYQDYIAGIPDEMLEGLDEETYYSDCSDRAETSCSSFEYDSSGYRAVINSDRQGLVYFSVPAADGWSVKVNGEERELIKVHFGMTAVPVCAGESIIECSYETPGLKNGFAVSFIAAGVFIMYTMTVVIVSRKKASHHAK